MCFLIGIGQPAGHLLLLHRLRIGGKRKWHNPLIAELLFHLRKIDAALIDTRRCARLETEHLDSQLFQGICQMVCRLQTIRSGRIAHIAIDTSRFQVRSRCQHHRLAVIRRAGVRFQSFDLTFFHDQLCHLSLTDRQVIGIFHGTAHLAGVFLLVRLRAERMHRRSLGLVEHLGLYKGFIYIFSHLAAERIQLAHQVALRASADIRVARHQGDAVHADGKHDRLESQSRACQRRLTAGVSRPDDRYIIIFC